MPMAYNLCDDLWSHIVSFLTYVNINEMKVEQCSNMIKKKIDNEDITNLSRANLFGIFKSKDELSLRYTCKKFSKILSSEEYYCAKVMQTFRRVTVKKGMVGQQQRQDGYKYIDAYHFPLAEDVGGWRVMYENILSLYTPLSGLYTICDAWPWGLLVRCSFVSGKFCGDLIRAVPNNNDDDDVGSNSNGYEVVLDRIFEITFGINDSTSICEVITIDKKKTLALEFGVTFKKKERNKKVFPRNADSFLLEIHWDAMVNQSKTSANFQWPKNNELPQEYEGIPAKNDIIQGIAKSTSGQRSGLLLEPTGTNLLDKSYSLCKPVHDLTSTSPLPKPGIYVASYGEIYRHLRHEMLSLYYINVDRESYFTTFGSRIPCDLDFFKSDYSPGLLMVGRKITGDAHVPAGEISWFADMTKTSTTIGYYYVDSEDGTRHRIIRAWDGMGTLAYLGFNRPSWNEGWLLELQDNLLAFCWPGRSTEVHTLHKMPPHST